MSMEDKNKLLDEYINDLALEVNKHYKGLIDKDKIKELYDKYKDSDKNLKEDIIPEIEDTINKLIDEYIKLNQDLESIIDQKMKKESDKLLELNSSSATISNVEMINSMVIGQLESKDEFIKYISDVCSKNPSLDSQALIDKFNSIVSEEQIEEIRKSLVDKYKTNLNDKYGNIELGSPKEIRTKLSNMGVDVNNIDEFVEKVAKGENVEALAQLVEKYGEDTVEKLNSQELESIDENDVSYDETKDEVYVKGNGYTKKLKLNQYNNSGIGYVAILAVIVSFGIGVISTMTYVLVSAMFK